MSLLEKRLAGKLKKEKKEKKENKNYSEGPKHATKKMTKEQLNKRAIEVYLEENNLPLLKLKNICFSIFDKDTFAKKKVCDIDNPNRNLDLFYSLEDPRTGTIDNWKICGTCDKSTEECAGHFSRINVGFNFIHPLYRPIVVMILQSICHSCNRLLLKEPALMEKNILSKKGFQRLKEISEESDGKQCSNHKCGIVIKFKKTEASANTKRFMIYYTKKGNELSNQKEMTVDTILARLKAINEEDLKTLGFKYVHPKNFIMDYIPVIPITDRPPGITESEKKDHSLTYAYNDILSKFLESKYLISEDDQERCYEDIVNIYNSLIVNKKNEPTTYTRNQQEAVEAIKDIINCKEGIIRNNLMGKRCDYTGRSVLGPNESLNFGYLALPKDMETITIPEVITHYNYKRLMDLAQEGRIHFLCPKRGKLAGRRIKFDYNKHKDKLTIGDRVERMTENGDVLTFNRAPTLQPQSMLGFNVVIQDKKTIGVHLSSTQGLNADFDGDEGNTHQIQTVEAQTEARLVMNADYNIMSYSNSGPEAALVYNSIVASFLLSDENVILEEKEFQRGLDYVNEKLNSDYVKDNYKTLDKRLGNIIPYSGKALFSVLFPKDFWYQHKEVVITGGVLRSGRIKADHVGSSPLSIISFLCKEYGKKVAVNFISAANFLCNWYIFRVGFTLSFKDITLREFTDSFKEKREKIVENTNKKLKDLNKKQSYTLTEKEEINKEISKTFDNAKNQIYSEGKKTLDYNNAIFVMVDSGAKGSESKALEIVASKGVISVRGSLPEKSMTNKKRWLTTFTTKDYRLQSRGFAINSYYEGLDVNAYFAECQTGRDGLIDTAVKTAKVGHMQRKMVKAQEDLIINYDGSIRNQKDIIFQFSYGPNFKTNEMILDNSDDNFSVFSFINIRNTIGKINYNNGFRFDIQDEIKDLAKKINSKYNFNDKNFDTIDEITEDNEEKVYISGDGDEDFEE